MTHILYDMLADITEVADTATGYTLSSYTYDNRKQLTGETFYDDNGNEAAAYTYTYDTAGNILSVARGGSVLHTYAYTDADWADLLTSFDGVSLTYDAIGNPLSYYNGASYTMTWEKGRRLSALTTGGTTTTYSYNMEGIRTNKTVGGDSYDFYTLDGKVVFEEINYAGNPYPGTLTFTYDANMQKLH